MVPEFSWAKQWKQEDIIVFSDFDAEGIQTLYNDVVVVSLTIMHNDEHHVLINNGTL